MSDPTRLQSFAEFWPFYVGEHRKPLTRALHYIGSSLVIGLLMAGIITGRFWLWAFMPLAGYGFAWPAHFFVEHNKPATFKYPFWSLASDFVMLGKALRGQMGAEVEALGPEASGAAGTTTVPSSSVVGASAGISGAS